MWTSERDLHVGREQLRSTGHGPHPIETPIDDRKLIEHWPWNARLEGAAPTHLEAVLEEPENGTGLKDHAERSWADVHLLRCHRTRLLAEAVSRPTGVSGIDGKASIVVRKNSDSFGGNERITAQLIAPTTPTVLAAWRYTSDASLCRLRWLATDGTHLGLEAALPDTSSVWLTTANGVAAPAGERIANASER